MNMKEYIDEAEKDLLHTYNRYQIVWDKGDGVHLMTWMAENIWISYPVLLFLHWAITTKHIMML